MDQHIEFVAEIEDNPSFLTVYSDSSLTNRKRKRKTGFGVVGYIQGCKVFRRSEALGEHVEVYDAKMVGLHAAVEEARRYITSNETHPKPNNLIFYADNSAAISKIFEGLHGKAQAHSRAFRKNISKILNKTKRIRIAISWCPGHARIIGNNKADKLAKSGALKQPLDPDYKSQAYIAMLHKQELLEAWRHRWTNTPNPPSSGFQPTNQLPPTLQPTERFRSTDQRTFSRLVQCRTGHAHLGEYSSQQKR